MSSFLNHRCKNIVMNITLSYRHYKLVPWQLLGLLLLASKRTWMNYRKNHARTCWFILINIPPLTEPYYISQIRSGITRHLGPRFKHLSVVHPLPSRPNLNSFPSTPLPSPFTRPPVKPTTKAKGSSGRVEPINGVWHYTPVVNGSWGQCTSGDRLVGRFKAWISYFRTITNAYDQISCNNQTYENIEIVFKTCSVSQQRDAMV